MLPWYLSLCEQFKWTPDNGLVSKLTKRNEEKLKELDAAIEEAVKEHGESEVREAHLVKAQWYCRIGDKVRRCCCCALLVRTLA